MGLWAPENHEKYSRAGLRTRTILAQGCVGHSRKNFSRQGRRLSSPPPQPSPLKGEGAEGRNFFRALINMYEVVSGASAPIPAEKSPSGDAGLFLPSAIIYNSSA